MVKTCYNTNLHATLILIISVPLAFTFIFDGFLTFQDEVELLQLLKNVMRPTCSRDKNVVLGTRVAGLMAHFQHKYSNLSFSNLYNKAKNLTVRSLKQLQGPLLGTR